ncbi:hypothetical protein C8J57DRAFT_138597 [Mycena rebaudengoi]|nr:hypothetical protein C8J57DRAFT_138597 [Mycena rebaudengoi]
MPKKPPISNESDEKCRIAEITQYSCVLKRNRLGRPVTHCVPIPRLFWICANQPAVEVTRVVNIDLNTGFINMPNTMASKLPSGKEWRDVATYDGIEDEF